MAGLSAGLDKGRDCHSQLVISELCAGRGRGRGTAFPTLGGSEGLLQEGAAGTWQAGEAAGDSQRGQRAACGACSQPWALNSVPHAGAVPGQRSRLEKRPQRPAKVTELSIPQAKPGASSTRTLGRAQTGEKPEIPRS